MNSFSTTLPMLTHSLAWALLHSLWQGALIFGSLMVLLKIASGLSPRMKYNLSMGAFGGMIVWFADTWINHYGQLRDALVYITTPIINGGSSTSHTMATMAMSHPQTPLPNGLQPAVEHYFPAIMMLYTIGLTFMIFRFVLNLVQVNALRTRDIIAPDQHWLEFVSRWTEQLKISRPVTLLLSARVEVPMMLGALKPVILLPVATINNLSTEQVEAILLHELAHIRRHDYLLNMLQAVGETVLFFNPFVWLVSGIIRRERELCCDDAVVAASASPLTYAHALAIIEGGRQSPLAMAATGNKKHLFHRIKRIMEMKKSRLSYGQLSIIIAAILLITFTAGMLTYTASYAQKIKKQEKKITTKKNVSVHRTVTIDSNGKKKITERVYSDADPGDDKDGGNGTKEETIVKEYRPDYSEDTVIIRFMSKDSTTVWARLYDNPVSRKRIIKEFNCSHKSKISETDWDEIAQDLEQLITETCKRLVEKPSADEIDKEIKKLISQQKKFAEAYQEELADGKPNGNKKSIAEEQEKIWEEYERAWVEGQKAWADGQKAMIEAEKEMNGVNWDEIYKQIEKSIKEVDKAFKDPKIRKRMKADLERSRQAIEEAK